MPSDFVSHLEELRKRVIVSLIAFFAGAAICYLFSHTLIEWLIAPLRRHQEAQLIFQTPYEAFLVHLKVAAVGGIFLSSPVIFGQFWAFVSPGLYEREKRLILPLVLISVLLFAGGGAFAYLVIIPWGLHFLLGFQTESLRPLLAIQPYFSFVFHVLLAFGVLFDLPVLLLGLVRLGILHSRTLLGARKVIIIGIFLAAAILTPPDPISQIGLALPLLALFEISVWIAKWMEKRPGNAGKS